MNHFSFRIDLNLIKTYSKIVLVNSFAIGIHLTQAESINHFSFRIDLNLIKTYSKIVLVNSFAISIFNQTNNLFQYTHRITPKLGTS